MHWGKSCSMRGKLPLLRAYLAASRRRWNRQANFCTCLNGVKISRAAEGAHIGTQISRSRPGKRSPSWTYPNHPTVIFRQSILSFHPVQPSSLPSTLVHSRQLLCTRAAVESERPAKANGPWQNSAAPPSKQLLNQTRSRRTLR